MSTLPTFAPYDKPLEMWRRWTERKIVKNWWIIVLGLIAFGVALFIIGSPLTAEVVAARVIEALGDVALDRGLEA